MSTDVSVREGGVQLRQEPSLISSYTIMILNEYKEYNDCVVAVGKEHITKYSQHFYSLFYVFSNCFNFLRRPMFTGLITLVY